MRLRLIALIVSVLTSEQSPSEMAPDLINGAFEMGGAFANVLSIKSLWKDKKIMGVHWAPTVFFFTWGLWNVAYYPMLNQWFSFIGALAILATNLIWIVSLIYFTGAYKWIWKPKVSGS